jgi:hypothetical protein
LEKRKNAFAGEEGNDGWMSFGRPQTLTRCKICW